MPMQVTYPANYSGPLPPNPVPAQAPSMIQPTGFNPAVNGNPAMDRRPTPGAAGAAAPAGADAINLGQLINVLQESPYPAQREWAAANLATFDWRVYPHLPQVLVQAARQDSAPTVRAAAVYSLSRMNLQSEPVLSTLQALRGDADPRVRQEVEQAFVRMGMRPTQQ
jgi:HEAT repeat protein